MHRPPLLRALVPLLGLLVAASCGGGGGGAPTPHLLDLGTHASTVPTRSAVSFANPLPGVATLTQGSASGPFSLDPADLPATLPAGGQASVGILFDPTGPGLQEGTVVLHFEGTGGPVDQTWQIRATGEVVAWEVTPTQLDFGAVTVGDSADRTVEVHNASAQSPVTFTSALLPASFGLPTTSWPETVGPGETLSLVVRFSPGSTGTLDGTLRLGPNDAGANLAVPLTASGVGAGAEIVTDYGAVPLDGSGRTEQLAVSVPSDAISLYLEGRVDSLGVTNAVGLYTLTGPGGKVYENASGTGDYIWSEGADIFATTVPNTDRTNVQLVPGGGTYTFQLRLLSGSGSTMHVRAIVERRGAGSTTASVLPLNVWLAKGISPTAASAPNDTFLQAVLTRIGLILQQQNVRLGAITYYDITDSQYDDVLTDTAFFDLLRLSSSASETRLNLFFVQTALGNGVVGVSAAVCGPKLNGTPVSGVMSVYGGYSSGTIGLIAAHEIGHYLGLYHTVEQDGTHDFIDDTPECPASGTNLACPTPGGGLLMHWQALGGTEITDGEGLVVRGHPLLDPDPLGGAFSKSRVAIPVPPDALTLPDGWCGTCSGVLGNPRKHP